MFRSNLGSSASSQVIELRYRQAREMFSITCTNVQVHAKHMTKPATIEIEKVADKMFMKLSKSDRKLARLLVAPNVDNESRPLSKTSIIETILELRDLEFNRTVPENGVNGGPRRYDRRGVKRSVLELPDTVMVNAPSVGDVAGVQINVKLDKPTERIATIELTSEVLEYLFRVVEIQRTNANIDQDNPINDDGDDGEVMARGVSHVKSGKHRGKIRAIHKTVGGNKISKFFKLDANAGSRQEVVEAAELFVRDGVMDDHEQADDGDASADHDGDVGVA
jgi:hypothetical protein